MSDASPSSASPLRGKRILVVEDEPLILLDIQDILESAGARTVVSAGRVDDGLKAIAASEQAGEPFDAGVLDLKLEKDSSLPIAEKLAAVGVPFVFLTGAPTDVALAHNFKSIPIVGKPFDSADLLAALTRTLSARP